MLFSCCVTPAPWKWHCPQTCEESTLPLGHCLRRCPHRSGSSIIRSSVLFLWCPAGELRGLGASALLRVTSQYLLLLLFLGGRAQESGRRDIAFVGSASRLRGGDLPPSQDEVGPGFWDFSDLLGACVQIWVSGCGIRGADPRPRSLNRSKTATGHVAQPHLFRSMSRSSSLTVSYWLRRSVELHVHL